MAKITTKTTTFKLKKSNLSGTVPCNICKGLGRLPAGYNKKKKK